MCVCTSLCFKIFKIYKSGITLLFVLLHLHYAFEYGKIWETMKRANERRNEMKQSLLLLLFSWRSTFLLLCIISFCWVGGGWWELGEERQLFHVCCSQLSSSFHPQTNWLSSSASARQFVAPQDTASKHGPASNHSLSAAGADQRLSWN